MFWYHLLRSEKLQTILYAMRNQCVGVICWNLNSSTLYYTQCEINVLISSAEVWRAPNYIIRNAKSRFWYRLLRSIKIQTILYAMRVQCFSIICRGMKRSKLHCTQWKINGLVSARSSKSMISNEFSTGNQNIYYLPLWQLSRFLYKLVIWMNSSAHICIYILYIHK